ncbi:glycosyltransferase family 2 protein [Massilimicrobiota sp. An142]|uniref:glycosyltransferase family 2 protein n=1 Tax=Massilimicrobiota sp. An142 TaxID=1965564 RepID=UPI0013020E05|nr:glycosyltransferase family 2 protein [Massilimicrobiota sp. An142]
MITVITPTYNRAHLLKNLYISLQMQTVFDFEWIVIDDGSFDNTSEQIELWIASEKKFKIKLIKKENGGKHRAINQGVKLAEGEFVFIVDSDDVITPDAIEIISKWIEDIKDNPKIVAVSGLRGNKNNEQIGDFPKGKDFVDVKNSERCINHLLGDKAEVYKKEILLEYPFPEFEGELFITEDVVWNLISLKGYVVRWYNKVIYKGNYLKNGLTDRSLELRKNNFNGYTYSVKQNFVALPFPYNFVALSVYKDLAKEKGFGLKKLKKEFNMSNKDVFLLIIISFLRKVRSRCGSN